MSLIESESEEQTSDESLKIPQKTVQAKKYNKASEKLVNFICDLCNAKFSLRQSLKFHFRVHLNQVHQCQKCPLKFSRRLTLRQHFSFVHEGRKGEQNYKKGAE